MQFSMGEGGVVFLDCLGVYRKTYLYNTLHSHVCGQVGIALACVSLDHGYTVHSRLKIPLDIYECGTCNIPMNTPHAEILKLAKLIIWDKASKIHRHAFGIR